MIITRLSFIAAAGAALASTNAARAAAADMVTVNVGIPPGTMGAIVEYAQERGFFKAAGLDVRISVVNSGAAIATALTGGSFEFGTVNVGSLASARLRGLPLRIIAPAALIPGGHVGGEVAVVRKESPIRSAADLNGKTVAIVSLKSIQHAAFLAWVDKHGGDPKSVKMFETPLPTMAALLETNHVDAAIMVEPYTTKSFGANRAVGASIYDALPLPLMNYAICATEPWLAANAATAVKFAAATRAAAMWANAHTNDSRAILATSMKLEPAVAGAMELPLMGTSLDPAQIAPLIGLLVKYGFLEKDLAPSDMIWHPA
jgi:NitT/TauT family transport system substrate-binding protein